VFLAVFLADTPVELNNMISVTEEHLALTLTALLKEQIKNLKHMVRQHINLAISVKTSLNKNKLVGKVGLFGSEINKGKEVVHNPFDCLRVKIFVKYVYPMLSCAFAERCVGNDEKAREIYHKLRLEIGEWERGHERYYDHFLYMSSFKYCFLDDSTERQKKVDLTDVMYTF
jgi:hypothetical protein